MNQSQSEIKEVNSAQEESYMQRCLNLASLGLGKVSPNPMVGALVVFQGKIIGEGWHKKFGKAHAEVNAIGEALDYLNLNFPDQETLTNKQFLNTILYVSLEPCSHFGKTPPCVDLILFHKIPKVFVACLDPNPIVSGNGIEKLRTNKVEVVLGTLEKEAKFLNRRFFTFQKKKRPYIILKWAETENQTIAPCNPEPYWISGELSQRLNHRWRTEEDAILIGKNTALLDQPLLTSRYWNGKNPSKWVLDWNLEIPVTNSLFHLDSPLYIVNGIKDVSQLQETQKNIHYIFIENREYLISFMLYQMYLRDICSVVIEGGGETIQGFIDKNLWDEARIIRSKKLFKDGIPSPELPANSEPSSQSNLGPDMILTFLNKKLSF